jgi:hypothetical protein
MCSINVDLEQLKDWKVPMLAKEKINYLRGLIQKTGYYEVTHKP